jgi:hypothetical protein
MADDRYDIHLHDKFGQLTPIDVGAETSTVVPTGD